jgi:hypothetical protein
MKFELYDEKSEPENQIVYLRLVHYIEPHGGTQITLVACDCNGIPFINGGLLSLHSDGTFHRWVSVGKHLGFQRDSGGKVIVQ